MSKATRRMIAMLLVLLTMFSYLPVTALAAGDGTEPTVTESTDPNATEGGGTDSGGGNEGDTGTDGGTGGVQPFADTPDSTDNTDGQGEGQGEPQQPTTEYKVDWSDPVTVTVGFANNLGEKLIARQEPAPEVTVGVTNGDSSIDAVTLLNSAIEGFIMPTAQLTETDDTSVYTYTVSMMNGDSPGLPTKITITTTTPSTEEGEATVDTHDYYLTWTISPTQEEYTSDSGRTFTLTGENGVYTYIENVRGYEEGDQVEAKAANAAFSTTVTWADNFNEAKKRPGSVPYVLQYKLDGTGEWFTLTGDDLEKLGLETMPSLGQTALDINNTSLNAAANTLTTSVTYRGQDDKGETHSVQWQIVPQEIDGYTLVKDENGSYTYVLLEDLSFVVEARQGESKDLSAYIAEIEEKLSLNAGQASQPLSGLETEWVYSEESGTYTLTIKNVPRYDTSGNRYDYYISGGDIEVGFEGDYLAPSYDNARVPNHGADDEKAYPGGTIYLTLTGEEKYSATKVWLDDGSQDRPNTTYALWRYTTKGDLTYRSASPVTVGGELVTLQPSPSGEEGGSSFTLAYGDALPKYDAEGYEYHYVVREAFVGGTKGYEQVFGSVNEDGTVTDTYPVAEKRPTGDTYLYNGGTLSNRKTGNVTMTVTKTWDAASYQDSFGQVSVTLEAYSRPVNDVTAEYQPTGEKVTLEGFTPEHLSVTNSISLPQYDALGRELDYQWQEIGVTINGETIETKETADGKRSFTIGDVTYTSTTTDNEDGSQTITNSIAGTITYQIIKKWAEGTEPKQVTFSLWRYVSGGEVVRYVSGIKLDGNVDEADTPVTTVTDANVSYRETASWDALVSGLPEFDEHGRQYEYILLEEGGYSPSIDTIRNDNGYVSTVVNGHGGQFFIMIRKEWVDDSDAQHRYPVTIEIYNKKNNERIKTVELHTGVSWYDQVGIEITDTVKGPEDIYILETSMVNGETVYKVTNTPTGDSYTGSVTTDQHVYEVTYKEGPLAADAEQYFFTVTNRRLGHVDLSVTKSWKDGADDTKRTALKDALNDVGYSLAVKLEVVGGNASIEGDNVVVGETKYQINDDNKNAVKSVQLLDLDQNTQKLYFYDLPKYDSSGAMIHYTVSEVFVDGSETEVAESALPEEVKKAYQDYRSSIQEGGYTTDPLHYEDTQEISISNTLTGTTDAVWYLEWKDDYVYKRGQRPNVYLDVYRVVRDEKGNESLDPYIKNYEWKKSEDDTVDKWEITMTGLPKYDAEGNEIEYYAVEKTSVNLQSFLYLDPQYAQGPFGKVVGNVNDGAGDITKEVGDIYALKSGNTFVNKIYDEVDFTGQKIWADIPETFSAKDLPVITFHISRSLVDGSENMDNVASITIDPRDMGDGVWDKLFNENRFTYVYHILYEGKNTLQVVDGALTATGGVGADRLPRFNDEGQAYTYKVSYEDIKLIEDTVTAGEVFESEITSPISITNRLKDDAQLSVKKILIVPQNAVKYPAITLELLCSYTDANRKPTKEEVVSTVTWTAAEVEDAAARAAVPGDGGTVTLDKTFTFEGLPIYAPNGSTYTYTVREKKDELNGYDTWAGSGDLSAEDKDQMAKDNEVTNLVASEDAEVDATILNEYDAEKVELSLTKQWHDYGDALGLRPDDLEALGLKLERRANSQTGMNNAIDWQEVTDAKFVLTQPEEGSNSWSITVSDLDRYAPNGMRWIYRVKETTVPDGYLGGNKTVDEKRTDGDGNITMKDLNNYTWKNVSYKKQWKNTDDTALRTDILGDVTMEVSFALQYRLGGSWEYATEQNMKVLFGDAYNVVFQPIGYEFTKTIKGKLSDSTWNSNKVFKELPYVYVKEDRTSAKIDWRVVETQVKILDASGKEQLYTQDMTKSQADSIFTGTGSGTGITNKLKTTALTVTKTWVGDSNDRYDTRPSTDATGKDWEVSFKIQRSTDDGANWTEVETVTVYGTDEEPTASGKSSQLPTVYLADGQLKQCIYRAVEQVDALEGVYRTQMQSSQDGETYTATNTLITTEYSATKTWYTSGSTPNVTLEIKYRGVDGSWVSFDPASTITIDGVANGTPEDEVQELAPVSGVWRAQWNKLPQYVPGSDTDEEGHTVYRVFEHQVNGFDVSYNYLDDETQITNNETVTIKVTKLWSGLAQGETGKEVTVGLYRDGEQTPVETLSLNAQNNWTAEFNTLPRFDNDNNGSEYEYTVKELSIDGQAVDPSDVNVVIGGDINAGFLINNIKLTDISVTKTWLDDSDSEASRPENLTLTLQRTTVAEPAEDDWETVKDVEQPQWTKDGDTWKLTYTGLPAAPEGAGQGVLYTYRVVETVPEGYTRTEYTTGEDGSISITNLRTGKIKLPVAKIWHDNNDYFGYRPASITFTLYRNGVKTDQTIVLKPDVFSWAQDILGWQTKWTGEFKDLDEFDDTGKRIDWTIREEIEHVPDGYLDPIVSDGDDTVHNFATAGIEITKKVRGDLGERGRNFNFTLTLTKNGEVCTDVSGVYGDLTFVEGVATFTLRHRQTVKATGLPYGLEYTVKEREANTGGYYTKATGAIGTTEPGVLSQVKFENYRSNNPKTGDESNIALWAGLAGLSLVAAGGIAFALKRRSKKTKKQG